MRYCQEKGIVCQYAGTNMHCRLTACVFPKESLYPTASGGGHLMDIEKLIERMNNHLQSLAAYSDPELAHTLEDAATALSTLQGENEKLREKIEDARLEGYAKGLVEMSEENEKLRAKLEQVKREGKIPRYTIGDTVYDCFGRAWEVTSVELHSMRTKNEWLYRCGHNGTDDYCALWHFEAFPSKEAVLRREQE